MKDSTWILFLLAVGVILFAATNTDTGNGIMTTITGGLDAIVQKMADAIQSFEGWFVGSTSYRNNNPGNLMGGSWQGVTGRDPAGFLIFDTAEHGRAALEAQLASAFTGTSHVYNPLMTLTDFFNKYASTSPADQRANYAVFVADQMGVTPDMTLADIAQV